MEDRRRFFRFEAPIAVTYSTDKEKGEVASRTKNISRDGIAFATEKKLDRNEILKMKFEIPGDNFPVFAQGTVVWVSRADQGAGAFDVGIKLNSITRADRGRVLEYAYQQWLKLKNIVR